MSDVDEEAATIVSTRAPSATSDGAFVTDLTRYELGDKLGAGGMAAVYRATDRKTGDVVALKIIENGDEDESRQARFEREVRAAGRLVHPNVCRVVSFGRAKAQLFMAMELVEGLTLQKMIKLRGTLPVPVALEALRQLLRALSCAHAAGVAHRDLKPANVMITPDGTLKLLDFGIAKSQEDATVTATGLLIGTPAFMAPEQILGKGTDVRSDLFSAGVTFLVMLTGKTRFHGMEPATVMVKVTSEPVGSLLEECPVASPAVDRFLQRMCAQDVEQRFQSADEALDELESLDDAPLSADGPALLAQYLIDPKGIATGLAAACAAKELERADRLLRGGQAAHPAVALTLYRASLLDPRDDVSAKLADVCAKSALTFDDVDDPKIAEAFAAFQKAPSAPGVLKRLADLYRARGNVLKSAAFLMRYLRVKPQDSHAATQLSVMLDGPELPREPTRSGARPAAPTGTNERLRTRDIIAGIKTGGHIEPARSMRPAAQSSVSSPATSSRSSSSAMVSMDAPTLARPSSIGMRPVTSQQPRLNGLPHMSNATGPTGAAPMVVVAGGDRERPFIFAHPLLMLVAAVVVAGLVLAFFSRFIRTTVDDVQLAMSDNEHRVGQAEESNIVRLRKNYLDEAQGQFDRGNWAASARQVNLLLATNPPADEALAGMWIRARARMKLDDKRSARVDLEEYLHQSTLADPHRDEAKRMLDALYAQQAERAAPPALNDVGAQQTAPLPSSSIPATPAGGGTY